MQLLSPSGSVINPGASISQAIAIANPNKVENHIWYSLLLCYISLATTAYAYQNKLHSGWVISTGTRRSEQFPATIDPIRTLGIIIYYIIVFCINVRKWACVLV